MSWWTTVAGLTPVAAFDAGRISGAQLLDGVGVNHITATSTLLPYDFQFKSVKGNGNPMAMSTPIPMPATGVVAGFWTPKRRNVLLTPGYNDTSGLALHMSDNGQGWYTSKANVSAPYGLYGSIDTRNFVAMVTRGSDSILYVDGNLVGIPVSSSHTMSQIGQIGYGANGNEYNLDTDEYFHALGVWTGVATQADVRAIEAALRLELAGFPAPCRVFSPSLGMRAMAPPEALDATGIRKISRGQPIGHRDIYYGGTGMIIGTAKNTPNTPVFRRIQLIHDATKSIIRETWSDPVTGGYVFENISRDATYTVISYDHTDAYRAVIADKQTPQAMP
jgi:hypothetical protein